MDDTPVLVLDFGGVISKTLFETHEQTEQALGLPSGSLNWRGPFEPQADTLWQMMQDGKISERDYWTRRAREVSALAGQNWTTMQEFVIAARGSDPAAIIRPEFLTALERVKKAGRRCAILSNELDLFYGCKLRQQLSFLEAFELIIDATYTGVLKPDPRAYEMICDGLGVASGTCVFVDDQLRNIKGAQAAAMKTVHFNVQDPQASYDDVLALLGITRTVQQQAG